MKTYKVTYIVADVHQNGENYHYAVVGSIRTGNQKAIDEWKVPHELIGKTELVEKIKKHYYCYGYEKGNYLHEMLENLLGVKLLIFGEKA